MSVTKRQYNVENEDFWAIVVQISPDTHEPVETSNNLVAIIGAVALGGLTSEKPVWVLVLIIILD